MSLKENQPRRGHLHGTSVNPTSTSGESLPEGQTRTGHLFGKSTNPSASSSGSDPVQGDVKGYRTPVTDRGIRPKRINDHVKD